MTVRQRLVSQVAAAIRTKPQPKGWSEWCKATEEVLSEIKAAGEAYDLLPNSRAKFAAFVRAVQAHF